MVLLKFGRNNCSKVSLLIDSKFRVQELTVMRGEDETGWRGDCNLWGTLITLKKKKKRQVTIMKPSYPLESISIELL